MDAGKKESLEGSLRCCMMKIGMICLSFIKGIMHAGRAQEEQGVHENSKGWNGKVRKLILGKSFPTVASAAVPSPHKATSLASMQAVLVVVVAVSHISDIFCAALHPWEDQT